MNEILQQLLSMGPGLGAAVSGDGNAFAAFMDGYTRMTEQLEQRKRLGQQDAVAAEERQARLTRQQAQDAQDAQDRAQQQALRGLQIPGHLAELGATGDTPEDAQRMIESAMPNLMSAFGPEAMAYGQPAVEMAQRTITGRQKKQVEAFVEAALKTAPVADNPDADPEIQLPEHISRIMGRSSARLSEVQSFAQLPIGKPAKRPPDEVSWQIKEGVGPDGKPGMFGVNPKTLETKPVPGIRPEPPRPPQSDPEIAGLRKDLLRLQVEKAGKPDEPNQAQFTSAGYAGRMEQAEPILTNVARSITAMSVPSFELQTNSWFAKPTFQSQDVQSYMQAARNFINAVLRRESGAVISPEEFREAKSQYLPLPGDTPETLAQKTANRRYVFETMKRSAAGAYEPPPLLPGASVRVGSEQAPVAKVGERRTFDGELREWNGTRWVKIDPSKK